MKKFFSLFVAMFVLVAVGYAQKGVIKFEKETHDFGKIEQGKPATYVFKFKNTGNEPIFISDAAASCGCTKPTWTKDAVMPGQTGTVSATYNAAAMGGFNKSVTVTSNAETATVVLYLKGEVVSKDQLPATADVPGNKAGEKKKGTKK